jgi:site-specific recombinase XerC
MTTRALQLACRRAAKAAGLSKSVTVHTLRHYAESRIMPSESDLIPVEALPSRA